MNVVLVHGFLNGGGIMRGLERHLASVGHTCFAPSLKPCDARCGLPAMGLQLDRFIGATLPEDARFALVGFSMGALISRYYLQELGGHRRVGAFFSIGGPHSGTLTAYAYPSEGVYQMRPRSDFLGRLDRGVGRLAGIPITCYWSPYDLMVRPGASARWKQADQVRIPAPLHSLMIFDRRLHRDIERRLSPARAMQTLEAAMASVTHPGSH
jgi:triacylglycerol lipase